MATECKDYDFQKIEPHWQTFWEENKTFRTTDDTSRPKYYVLDMFPYPSGSRPAHRPSRGLHRDGHRGPLPAGAGLQRPASDRLGCVRPSGRAACGEDRRASARQHRGEHQELPPPAEGAGLLLRLGPRGQHDRPGLLQVDAVDFPAAFPARPRLRRRAPRVVVSGAEDRARQRGGRRRQVRGRRPSRSSAAICASGCCASRRTPTGCWPD